MPLGSAVIAVHHQKDLYHEVEVGVVQKLLPNETTRAVGMGVLQVELSKDPIGVALLRNSAPKDDLLYSAGYSEGELVGL